MNKQTILKQLSAAALAALALTGCGGQKPQEAAAPAGQEAAGTAQGGGPSDRLQGIYDALISPDSSYSKTKGDYTSYYPELEYKETLAADRITISLDPNGNEYITGGSWDFVEEGDYLTTAVEEGDYNGTFLMMNMADAVGAYYGMDTDLISGYLNGLGTLDLESVNFSMAQDAGTTTYKLNIAGPWDMKELDQMVLNEAVLGGEPLGSDSVSQSGNVGKVRMMANGSADYYTVLIAEYGGLDDLAYQSIVNVARLRKPAGWESFLADFDALKELETEGCSVDLDPDSASIEEMMGPRNDKFSYALIRFGTEPQYEESFEAFVPPAEAFADFYFRPVAGCEQGTAGASLDQARVACDVLGFAAGNGLWAADIETLRANMLEGWESLSEEERTGFDASFPDLAALLSGCFEDWDAHRGAFEDAGAADAMADLLADPNARQSWETLNAHTWTLGNG